MITGGNDGIGAATAKRFVEEGANVVIFGRRREKLDEVVDKLGSQAYAVQGDVTKIADLKKLFKKASKRFGKIDIVVPNAGICEMAPVGKTTEEFFNRALDVNLKGAFFTVQESLPYLNDSAAIVLISSIARMMGLPTHTVYTTSKAGVKVMTETLASELIPRGVRVNCVTPGLVDTKMLWTIDGFDEEAVSGMITASVPIKRAGSPKEIANGILFLASDASSFIYGQELVIDGGQTSCVVL